jgi:hypothetical protein
VSSNTGTGSVDVVYVDGNVVPVTAGRATLFARPAALSLRLPAANRRGKD